VGSPTGVFSFGGLVKEEYEVEEDDEAGEASLLSDPKELLEDVAIATKLYSELVFGYHEQFVFMGQSLTTWSEEMTIRIPSNLDQKSLREVLTQVAMKTQEAASYYSLAYSLYKAFASGSEMKKSDLIAILVSDYQKRGARRPAAAILEKTADSLMKSSVSTKVASLIVKDFWHQKLETFEKLRKLTEQLGMSLHVEYKHTSN
jgi:hypothetical protein